jgi:siroheme synthase (precorrin-2 oxidase/ferrochelatase)
MQPDIPLIRAVDAIDPEGHKTILTDYVLAAYEGSKEYNEKTALRIEKQLREFLKKHEEAQHERSERVHRRPVQPRAKRLRGSSRANQD